MTLCPHAAQLGDPYSSHGLFCGELGTLMRSAADCEASEGEQSRLLACRWLWIVGAGLAWLALRIRRWCEPPPFPQATDLRFSCRTILISTRWSGSLSLPPDAAAIVRAEPCPGCGCLASECLREG